MTEENHKSFTGRESKVLTCQTKILSADNSRSFRGGFDDGCVRCCKKSGKVKRSVLGERSL